MDINELKNKTIHIVGITGSESSSVLPFLLKHGVRSIVCHDYCEVGELEENYKLWHKGIGQADKEKAWQKFSEDIQKTTLYTGKEYLSGIERADLIFVPQSWRLYKRENHKLFLLTKKDIPFYNLTRLYLEYSKATTIAVTGTVGKGSTAYILVQLLQKAGKQVFFAGNDTWMMQSVDKLDEMTKEQYLVLEVSHRQLLDGIAKGPDVAVITNIFPNHLDEVNFEEYKRIKLSLLEKQPHNGLAVVNYESLLRVGVHPQFPSRVVFFSSRNKEKNSPYVKDLFDFINRNKSGHYRDNLLCAVTIATEIGIAPEKVRTLLDDLSILPARIQHLATISGVLFFDDIKSTTPWGTIAAVKKFGKNTILISGGDTKGIDYKEFIVEVLKGVKHIILLPSQLTECIREKLPPSRYTVCNSLEIAIEEACSLAKNGDVVLVSPAAAFFYSKYIAGKKSLKKIITSLLPKDTT